MDGSKDKESARDTKIYRFGIYLLNPLARRLATKGRYIDIKPKTLEVLTYLVRNAGSTVTKDEILDEVCLRCTNELPGTEKHRHVRLWSGRASAAERYPLALIRAILRGLVAYFRKGRGDRSLSAIDIGQTVEEPEVEVALRDWVDSSKNRFHDDIIGFPLDADLVRSARRDEVRGRRNAMGDATSTVFPEMNPPAFASSAPPPSRRL